MIIILCFDYSDGFSVVEVKHIVGKLRLTTSNDIATNVDPTIRDLGLHRNVTLPSIKNDRSNIIQFDVFFRHLFLAQYGHVKTS